MAKIILKMPYIKACNLPANYATYIATRAGVDKGINFSIPAGNPTEKQVEFINKLVEDFPLVKDSFEYEDYIENVTSENASKFITAAIEQNPDFFSGKENYVNYIATRPRAQKICNHGLFGMSDNIIQLENVKKEIKNYRGNVWTPIISLRREDAERLEYDNAEAWKRLLKTKQTDFAKCLGIPLEDLRMYGAYHDEGYHPHVHMIVYSANPKNGYVATKGIETLKSSIARDIFKLEMYQLYDDKTISREKISDEIKHKISDLVQKINAKNYSDSDICNKLLVLSDVLKSVKGKKAYGYLRPEVKAMADEIVQDIASDEIVVGLYKTWCDIQNKIIGTYKSNFDEHPPLWENKEFKKIKNAVISEALKIGNDSVLVISEDGEPEQTSVYFESEPKDFEFYDEIEQDADVFMDWTENYKEAMKYFYGNASVKQDLQLAFELLSQEAEDGNVLAIHDLGLMFRLGLYAEANEEIAQAYYTRAFDGFSYLEAKKRNPYIEYRLGKLHYYGFGTEQNYSEARKLFEMSGNKYAHYWLGKIYYFGYGVEINYETAAQQYRISAEKGVDHAQYALGKLYCSGEGVKQDYSEAAMWFECAAIQGNPFAQYRLGCMYYLGLGVKKNDAQALSWLISSAKQGNQFAQYMLGKMYKKGEGTVKNEQIALKYFLLSAEQKNHYAQYEAAELFYSGEEINIDIDRANSLYQQALHGFIEMERQASTSDIQFRIGKMFELGLGTEINMTRAIEYYEKAAENENSFAELKLAKIYFYGNGVNCDIEKAMAYLDRAIEHGNEYAKQFKEYILRVPPVSQSLFYLFARLADMIQQDAEDAIRKHNYIVVDRKVMIEILKKKQELGLKF